MRNLFPKPPFRLVIRRYEAILMGSILLLSGAVIPSSWEPPAKFIPRPEVDLTPRRPWIALTFDDGPHAVMTEKLLDVLDHEHVPGTFFVVGKMAQRNPDVLRDIARRGHEVANHTYSHPRLSHLEDQAVLNELAQTRGIIQRITGHDSILFRPPGGDYTRDTVRVASRAGYKMILWSVLTKDVQGVSGRFIRGRILRGAEDGGIILMHSGMPNTVEALPGVIAELRKRGYHFVTVSTLLGLQHPKPYTPSDRLAIQTASAKTGTRSTVQ
jgi:peptidoglycan-N-acetylglucosamine deacetylase